MRIFAALLLALLAITFSLPSEVVPWIGRARAALHADRLLFTVLVSLIFALAGRLLPDRGPPRSVVDHTGLTVGLLLLLEPLLHLTVLGVCAQVANPYGAEALLPMAWAPSSAGEYALRLVILAGVTPVCEEFFFRGRLLPWLRGHVGAWSAVSISALVFAAAHGEILQVAIALPVGVLLGCMRLAGADLGACMLAHAVHNGLFLIAGSGLIGLPAAAPLLAGAGLVLVVIAWFYHLRPRPGQLRHALIATVGGALVIFAIAPYYRALVDRWWAAGVHRICVYWRVPNEHLLARLLAQERNHRLTDVRRAALVATLQAMPCLLSSRQTGVITLLEPPLGLRGRHWEDDAAILFDELANTASPTAANGELARRFGLRFPEAFADVALEYPEVMRRWLPLPERAGAAALQLQFMTGIRERRILLGALEHVFPGAVADVISRMPAEALTALERRHLRMHYGRDSP